MQPNNHKEMQSTNSLPSTCSPHNTIICVEDELEQLANTLASIKSSSKPSDVIASILSSYATRWLPEIQPTTKTEQPKQTTTQTPDSPTATWLKKRFFVEALVSVIPNERNAVHCDFMLRLLRAATMVGAETACVRELEARVAAQLDEASLKELMIPAFSHTCGTLLDVALVTRLVVRFVGSSSARSGGAVARVAKLVDSYLAEAAVDGGLTVNEFEELARALPAHARAHDDGIYRAIDTFIKAHPSTSKQERKSLCRLIDARKLSSEASMHAAQNERLPVRSVIQVLFSESTKLNRLASGDWSGSFSGPRSPNLAQLETPGRCSSKREVLVQQQEMRRLRDDVARLQLHCHALQAQIDKLTCEKKKRGLFSFLFKSSNGDAVSSVHKIEDYNVGGRTTENHSKKWKASQAKATPTKWRNSTS